MSMVWTHCERIKKKSKLVNPGDNYVAYCNIPGKGGLDIISNLKVKWLHNGQPLTRLCEILSVELAHVHSTYRHAWCYDNFVWNVKLLCSVFKTSTYVIIPNTYSDLLCFRYMILIFQIFNYYVPTETFEPSDYKVT